MHRLPDDDVSSPLHPLVRTMADDFHGPRAEDLDQLHQLQKSTKRPAKGEQKSPVERCLHALHELMRCRGPACASLLTSLQPAAVCSAFPACSCACKHAV
jgi:hypothetical protein